MVDWLLKGEPRHVQIEALRRSYYGEALWDMNPTWDEAPASPVLRKSEATGPRRGWGHLLQMRLGKTPTALAEMELFRRDHFFKNMIMFTPNKYKLEWPMEAERFGFSLPSFAFESTNLDDAKRWVAKNHSGYMLAVNYDALLYKKNVEFLGGLCNQFTYIGADESILLKNPNGKWVKPAVAMAKECGARRIFSGKPMTQGPSDMWAQLRFIGAITGIAPVVFQNMYCKMGGFQGRKVLGPKNEEQFHALLDGCSWQARQSEWLRIPTTDYAECRIDLDPVQMRLYKQMQEEFLTELENGTLVVADQIITKLIKLQQITSGFIIDENGVAHDLVPIERNVKAQEILLKMDEEIEGKAVIICKHTHSINMLQTLLMKYQPAIIAGGHDTVIEKQRFNTDPNCRVCIGQTKSIKYGHSLRGTPDDPCNTILMFENTYSLDDRSQLEERPRGEGMATGVTVWDFVATPQDLAPIRALQLKEDVASMMLRYDRRTGILPPKPMVKAE